MKQDNTSETARCFRACVHGRMYRPEDSENAEVIAMAKSGQIREAIERSREIVRRVRSSKKLQFSNTNSRTPTGTFSGHRECTGTRRKLQHGTPVRKCGSLRGESSNFQGLVTM